MPDSPPKPTRKRGGQPGNLNAATHGFYCRQLKPADLAGLDNAQAAGLEQEIELLRVYVRRLLELGGESQSFAEAAGQLYVVCLAFKTLTSLIRTQQFILAHGGGELNASVYRVLAEFGANLEAHGAANKDSPASDYSVFNFNK